MKDKKKVLLVEDEKAVADTMAAFLNSEGYSVAIALSSDDALEAISKDPPDAAFIDVIMPDTDGFELLKKIRGFNQALPVIMMSGYIEDSRSQKKVNFYGARGVYYKGRDFQEALDLLERALTKED